MEHVNTQINEIVVMYLSVDKVIRPSDERFTRVMGECDLEDIGALSIFHVILSTADLARMFPTLNLSCEVYIVNTMCGRLHSIHYVNDQTY